MISNQLLSIISAILAVICYTLYSRNHEILLRMSDKKAEYVAFALYFCSSVVCIGMFFFSVAFFGFDYHISTINTIGDSSYSGSMAFFIVVLAVMAIAYAKSIFWETKSRFITNMGLFSILFQLNTVFFLLFNYLFHHISFSIESLIGALLIKIAIICTLWFCYLKDVATSVSKKTLLLYGFFALLSSFFYAVGVFCDTEITSSLIFTNQFEFSRLSLFLLYETLTFALPTLVMAIYIFITNNIRKAGKDIVQIIITGKQYILSASISTSLYYVLGILALSLTDNKIPIAVILSMVPLLDVAFDRNRINYKKQKYFEYSMAISVGIGLRLLFQ